MSISHSRLHLPVVDQSENPPSLYISLISQLLIKVKILFSLYIIDLPVVDQSENPSSVSISLISQLLIKVKIPLLSLYSSNEKKLLTEADAQKMTKQGTPCLCNFRRFNWVLEDRKDSSKEKKLLKEADAQTMNKQGTPCVCNFSAKEELKQ
ncbi:uncharacterized protein LOC130786088 [Actinidia eriantha]|uniref:uncharacterized protein LOC130786088 n=1 Tax=Actinidia eriantha TaxID=165200 RepID=UPI00258E1324|nr:uncharacterized protein LOC130786088 [Actinidia eriantha]